MDYKIKKIRKEKGFSQKQIAKKLEITAAALCQKENNKRKFNAGELLIISKLYNVDIEDLI